MRWFDRSFPLEIPVWMHPNILERLRGTPARIEERVQNIKDDLLLRRFQEKWSIKENIGHLLDLESLWQERLDDFSAGAQKLRPADLENRKTAQANHNAKPCGDILKNFRAARQALTLRLESLGEAELRRSALHPRLGKPMSVVDMMFFIAEHDDHHAAAISRIMREAQ